MPFHPDEEFMAELRAMFSVEAAEHIASLNRDLVALEKSGSIEDEGPLLKEIFRNAHTLKGGASAVGLDPVRVLAHHLESLLGKIQNGELAIGPTTFDLVYQTVDVIKAMIEPDVDPEVSAEFTALVAKLSSIEGIEPAEEPAEEAAEEPKRESPASTETLRHAAADQGGETVRISTTKLDNLMTHVGQLLVANSGSQWSASEIGEIADGLNGLVKGTRKTSAGPAGHDPSRTLGPELEKDLTELIHRVNRLRDWIRADARRMDLATDQLQEEVRRARMLPISTIFSGFPRMVRDLARNAGKKVRLEIRGEDTEMDRSMLEQLKAPVTHLLRNCVDHGLEDPEARSAAGKAPEGLIVLSALQKGATTVVEITDDGAGIDIDRVKATAVANQIIEESDLDDIGAREAHSLIFHSGFSTSPLITSVSGRGVGLDVVRENVERMNGTIEVRSTPKESTTFTLIMPLTVATTRCALVSSGGQTFGVPLTNIVRTVRVLPEETLEAEGREAITLPDGPLPLRDLADVLGLEGSPWQGEHRPVLIARSADRTVGLAVDEVLGVNDVVVKNLPRPLLKVRHVTGATVFGSGNVAVVLHMGDVLRSALQSVTPVDHPRHSAIGKPVGAPKVLLVDDSITTRTLEKNILQAAGYEVSVAVDGAEAWAVIETEPPDIVVSDVQMPRLDGFELTAKIRSDERFKHLPVVLVTSLESENDRKRGVEVGADAYITKSSFDQEHLLDTVRRLI